MTVSTDNLNCLKNLMQIMCIDGKIHTQEKVFLAKASRQLGLQVDDWNGLIREVLKDGVSIYPVHNRDKAISTLKSLIVMSKVDGQVDPVEKSYALKFAKSIGVNKAEWKQILENIDPKSLFEPFTRTNGHISVIRDDFEKLEAFLQVAADNGAATKTVGLRELLESPDQPNAVVCFHAAEDKDSTVTRCRMLLEKCGDKLVCILTRFQGHQVKYLLEIGLSKCIIEPVYERDILEIFK